MCHFLPCLLQKKILHQRLPSYGLLYYSHLFSVATTAQKFLTNTRNVAWKIHIIHSQKKQFPILKNIFIFVSRHIHLKSDEERYSIWILIYLKIFSNRVFSKLPKLALLTFSCCLDLWWIRKSYWWHNFFFFKFFFGGHMSFLWAHWYPCFGLLVMSALHFKATVDSPACFLACALFLRFTSGVTPADILMASMAAEPLWPTYLQPSDVSSSIGGIEVGAMARTYGLGQVSNSLPTVRQHSALNHLTIPARLLMKLVLIR